MSSWNSSSLAFSNGGHHIDRHKSGLLHNLPDRISKQHIVEHKLFGKNRGKTGKSLKIGKKFKKVGKGIMHGAVSAHMTKSSGISPSVEDFDKMMANVLGKGSKKEGKKSMFSRKSFG